MAFPMPSQQITLVVLIHAKPGQEAHLEKELHAMIAPSRAEAGCVNYDLHRDPQNPLLYSFYENWRTAADLDAHRLTPHYVAFKAATGPLVEKVEVHTLEMISQRA